MIGRTVLFEEVLDGVLHWTGVGVITGHDFPWLEMKALSPFRVGGNVGCPLKDLRLVSCVRVLDSQVSHVCDRKIVS